MGEWRNKRYNPTHINHNFPSLLKKSLFYLLLTLLVLPAGMMLGLQIDIVRNQHQANKENFDYRVEQVMEETKSIYARWISHTTSYEDEESYNSVYVNEDSTFSVIIAQSVQEYPLLDFSEDTVLPGLRMPQFQKFARELEATRRSENSSLKEFYLLRSIQYCADCEAEDLSISEIFPLDSLIRRQLLEKGIETEVQIGFYNVDDETYNSLARQNSDLLLESPYRIRMNAKEEIHLLFPALDKALRSELMSSIISSIGLSIISLICFVFAIQILIRYRRHTTLKIDFINNITHELKTPIATINFAIANIEKHHSSESDSEILSFTSVIRNENKRLNQRVEKLLRAAAFNSGVERSKKERIDLHQVLLEQVKYYTPLVGSSSSIEYALKATQSEVTGDYFHLSNVFSNLLGNAMKYTGDKKEIRIETRNIANTIEVRINDNGMGISQDHQKLIFEQFFRVNNDPVGESQGFGLGLSYVKSVIKEMGGDVAVNSELGKGATFVISIPTRV